MRDFLRIVAAMAVFALLLSARAGAQNIAGIINIYAVVQSIDRANATVDVESAAGFSAGDQVLLIQMQGAEITTANNPSYGEVRNRHGGGDYEFGTIRSISGNRITLGNPLVHGGYAIEGKVQLVRVPVYDRAVVVDRLTCKPWNGATGGVLALSAGCLVLRGEIDVSGAGYRGAVYQHQEGCADNPNRSDYVSSLACRFSLRGEGLAGNGRGTFIYGRGAAANSGGGGNNHNAGGGGGGNYGAGGQGGFGYDAFGNSTVAAGIGAYSLATLYGQEGGPLFMGGGGGGGHINNRHGSGGANGGGIIVIRAGTIDAGNHTIKARGENAKDDPAPNDPDGCGGGGAGGAVVLDVGSLAGMLVVDVSGGNGGSRTRSFAKVGPGGGGGGGLVGVTGDTVPAECLRILADGGNAGTAVEGGTYGAANGRPGTVITGFQPAGYLPELSGCDSIGTCRVRTFVPVLPPVLTQGESSCYGTVIVAMDTVSAITDVALDSLASSNVSIWSVDGLPSGLVTIAVYVQDRSKDAHITLRVTNAHGKQAMISTNVTVLAGSSITVLGIAEDQMRIDTTATRTRRCRAVELRNDDARDLVIPSAAFLRNVSFSVPPGQFPLVIPPGATGHLDVCFEPTAAGADHDTLIVADLCPLRIAMASFGSFSGEGVVCNTIIGIRQAMPGAAKVNIGVAHPNPGSATIEVPVEILGNRDAAMAGAPVMRDMFGSVVRSPEYSILSYSGTGTIYREQGCYRLDVASLPQGLYWLMIPTMDGVVSHPIMVVH